MPGCYLVDTSPIVGRVVRVMGRGGGGEERKSRNSAVVSLRLPLRRPNKARK